MAETKITIVRHLYENKNGTIREEYRVYNSGLVYESKTRKELTKTEKEWLEENGTVIVYHF